jgi:hypothetical protein
MNSARGIYNVVNISDFTGFRGLKGCKGQERKAVLVSASPPAAANAAQRFKGTMPLNH